MCGGGNDKISSCEICKKNLNYLFNFLYYYVKYINFFESYYFVYEFPKQQIVTCFTIYEK
jgi:hypothetical protein